VSQSPSGIADLLIIYLSSAESSEFNQAKQYVDCRREIPIKVLCSESPLIEEAALLDCKYVHVSEVTGAAGSETIIKEARKLEETLLNCFNKFDINGNGLISVDELVKVSDELGHHLEHDDAKMIADSLDETKSLSGNISFEGFKKWWVMGKSDFHAFRRICKAEMSVNNLIKLTSKKFNSYLENLKESSQKVSEQEVLQTLNLNLHSKQSFENGAGLFLEICSGPEAKEIIDSLSENVRNSPQSVSIRVSFSDAESAKSLCEVLSMIVTGLVDENPRIRPLLDMGLKYALRTSGSDLVLDFYVTGTLEDMMVNQSQQFNKMQNVYLTGNITLHVFTALTMQNLLEDAGLFNVFEKFLHLKFHLNSKSYGLRQLWAQFSQQIKMEEIPGLRQSAMLIDSIIALRCFNFDFNFDVTDVKNFGLEAMAFQYAKYDYDTLQLAKEALLGQKGEEILEKGRQLFTEFKKQAEGMKAMIPEDFLPIIKAVNFEKIQFEHFTNLAFGTCVVKATINLPGLNGIRDEFFA